MGNWKNKTKVMRAINNTDYTVANKLGPVSSFEYPLVFLYVCCYNISSELLNSFLLFFAWIHDMVSSKKWLGSFFWKIFIYPIFLKIWPKFILLFLLEIT